MRNKKQIFITHEEVVRFNEVDAYRIVHNTHYYNYFDIGRTYFVNMLFRRTSPYDIGDTKEPYYFLVLKSQCKYKYFAKLGDTLQVKTIYQYNSEMQSSLIELEHEIRNKSTRKMIAEGTSELGICNRNYELLYTIPEDLYAEFKSSIEFYQDNPGDLIQIR